MIPLEVHIFLAFLLDAMAGDPRWFPHPVKYIGRAALALEAPMRKTIRSARLAGLATALLAIGGTALAAWALILAGAVLHPVLGDVVSIILLWTAFAARDLAHHGVQVYRALRSHDLVEARRRVGMLVGRDADQLDEPEIVRATAESVAENTVDGMIAPLLFALCFGPVGAMAYKAINTLDSTFGYKNERYLQFGWASARIDDWANWLPSRLAAFVMIGCAFLLRMHGLQALRTFWRDRHNHPSPNGGQIESVVAGALNFQLGGLNYYFGVLTERPRMGKEGEPKQAAHIRKAIRFMYATVLATLLVGLELRVIVVRLAFT